MNVGFIGAGKVGRSLGLYLYNKGISVMGYTSLNIQDAKEAASLVKGEALSLEALVDQSDIVFITVNDDHIEMVSKDLAKLKSTGKIFVHTSGVHSSMVLEPLAENEGTIVSMHPLQSFVDIDMVQKVLPDTAFSTEGSGPKFDAFRSWMSLWTSKWFEIKAEDKGRYHMAAAIVSNYLVSVLNYGIGVMESIGLSEEVALDALKPLIDGTLANVYEKGKVHSLTGPISRGDIQTIENHISVLKSDEADLYKVLGLKTVAIAEEKDPDLKEKLDAIKEVLK